MTGTQPRTFWAFGVGYNGGAVIQALPEGGPELFRFYEGRRLGQAFPAGGTIEFSSEYRKEIKVFDSVSNDLMVPIVSDKVVRIFKEVARDDCEFLPVRILNHKGKVASDKHFILNTLKVIDFVDMARSKYESSALQPDQISWLHELRVLPDVDSASHVFRASAKRDQVFIDDRVYRMLEMEKLTGLRLFPAEGWDGDDM